MAPCSTIFTKNWPVLEQLHPWNNQKHRKFGPKTVKFRKKWIFRPRREVSDYKCLYYYCSSHEELPENVVVCLHRNENMTIWRSAPKSCNFLCVFYQKNFLFFHAIRFFCWKWRFHTICGPICAVFTKIWKNFFWGDWASNGTPPLLIPIAPWILSNNHSKCSSCPIEYKFLISRKI